MKFIKKINFLNKLILLLALILLIYGILSRIIPIYFFWESLTVSWILFSLGIILIFRQEIIKRKLRFDSVTAPNLGMGIIFFILIVQSFLFLSFQNSDMLKVAKDYLNENNEITNEIGTINKFSIIPMGKISINKNKGNRSGKATLKLILKGEKAYKKVTLYLQKTADSDWKIIKTD